MYKVIKYFTDLHDENYPYNVGDIFPREGIKVTSERLAELAGSENKHGMPLIELVEEQEDDDTKSEDETKKEPAKKSASKKTSPKASEK